MKNTLLITVTLLTVSLQSILASNDDCLIEASLNPSPVIENFSELPIEEYASLTREQTIQDLNDFQTQSSNSSTKEGAYRFDQDVLDSLARKRESKKFSVLSLDGGGIRGLITATWLKYLDTELQDRFEKKHLYEFFDYIGGTSIGGILALSVASDMDVGKIINLFENERGNIFPVGRFGFISLAIDKIRNVFGGRYSADPLEALLQRYFTPEATLGQLKTNVFITASTTENRPWFFSDERDCKIWEVARATSAAPTYFPGFNIPDLGQTFVDGGFWANNPSEVALRYIEVTQNFRKENVRVLSLGTGTYPQELPANPGLRHVRGIIDGIFANQALLTDTHMQLSYGRNYHRINPVLAHRIELNDIRSRTINTLKEIAADEQDSVRKFVQSNEDFLRLRFEERN